MEQVSTGPVASSLSKLWKIQFDCACAQWGDAPSAQFVTVGTIKNPKGTMRLKHYWTKGKGAAKIRWGTDGSYSRCVRLLTKYFPKNPRGLCANLHKQATGEWPAEKGIPS